MGSRVISTSQPETRLRVLPAMEHVSWSFIVMNVNMNMIHMYSTHTHAKIHSCINCRYTNWNIDIYISSNMTIYMYANLNLYANTLHTFTSLSKAKMCWNKLKISKYVHYCPSSPCIHRTFPSAVSQCCDKQLRLFVYLLVSASHWT